MKRWQTEVLSRLSEAGHRLAVRHAGPPPPGDGGLGAIMAIERRRYPESLVLPAAPPEERAGGADLVVDLTGAEPAGAVPVLSLSFAGQRRLHAGLAQMLRLKRPPEIVARLDGVPVGRARPMIGDRLWLSRASSDYLAGAVSLVKQCVGRFASGRLLPLPQPIPEEPQRRGRDLLVRYIPHLLGGIVGRRAHKLLNRPFYWQTAYRRVDGPGVAEAAGGGGPFALLPDDGARFFADPFVIERGGEIWLFVEEYPYATGKGVISAARLGDDGHFEAPRPVLEEPHHLSYPQVFESGGEVWMIPEGSAARQVVLYRAARFPDRWVREAVLVDGKEISDATLLEQDGRFWLFGTERRCRGNASDTMVAYSADRLTGPWLPHPMNPILIDLGAARPGGAFIRRDGRTFLPVQDGTLGYGGGLGLAELLRLDSETVEFAPPRPVGTGGSWKRRGIHTLNRAGGIEVIDSAG